MSKQQIKTRAAHCVLDKLEDGIKLGDLRDRVLELCRKYGEDAELKSESRGYCNNCDDDDIELTSTNSDIWITREETDAELFSRETREARRSSEDERRARADYERLRARFETKPEPPAPVASGIVSSELAAGMRSALVDGLALTSGSTNVDDAKPGSAP